MSDAQPERIPLARVDLPSAREFPGLGVRSRLKADVFDLAYLPALGMVAVRVTALGTIEDEQWIPREQVSDMWPAAQAGPAEAVKGDVVPTSGARAARRRAGEPRPSSE